MYRILSAFICVILISLSLSSCDRQPFERQLKDLDRTIQSLTEAGCASRADELAGMYHALSAAWSDSLQWEACYSLFDWHFRRNTDSTIFYLDRMMELQWDPELIFRSKVCRAKVLSVTDASRLETYLPEIMDVTPGEAFRSRYYSMMIDIYSGHSNLYSYPSHFADYLEAAIADSSYRADTLLYYLGLRAMTYNEASDALQHMLEAYEVSDDHIVKGACAECISSIYSSFSNPLLEKKWLISAAGHQLKGGEGELHSLYRLSLILSDEGDFSRAAQYVRTVIERASSAGYPDLVLDSATGSLAITTTLDKIDANRQNILFTALGGAIVVLIFILVLLLRDRRKSRLILSTKEALMMSNRQLEDANKIKDGYLIAYMNLSISYLEMIDDNRRMFRRILKEQGIDALNAELRKPSSTIDEYKDFYRTFDNVFLSLYPDFVSRINRCMRPEDSFKENGKLTTPLRILALIRLGIVESGEIARFLNCSPETIYSHRSRLKSKAMCRDFEDHIKNIGK